MFMWNTFSDSNSCSSFKARKAVISINVVIWDEESLTSFQMCLREKCHVYTAVLQLFTDLEALLSNTVL